MHTSKASFATPQPSSDGSGGVSSSKMAIRTPPQLSLLQRGMLAVGSSLVAFVDPERADMVAALGETTGS